MAFFATLDTETENGFLGEAICCQYLVCTDDGEDIITPSYKVGYGCIKESLIHIQQIFEHDDTPELRIYVHNLTYDLMRLASENIPLVVAMNGGEVISAETTIDNLRVTFLDSYKLLPASLDNLSKSFLPPELRKKKKENMENFDIESEEDLEYALFDVIALKHILLEFGKIIGVNVSKLKRTAPSQAFDFLKKSYSEQARNTPRWKNPKGQWKATPKDFNLLIAAKFYYGGRIYIRDNHSIYELNDAESLDITSSYPYQMKLYKFPLPSIKPVVFAKIPPMKGRFFIQIYVKDYYQDIPCIPYRQKNGSVCYPHGSFNGFISDIEYNFINKHYKLNHEVVKVWFWSEDKCANWSEPYIDEYYEMKLNGDKLNEIESGKGNALRTVGKLFLNSPYGKAAQKYSDFKPLCLNGAKEETEEREIPDHRNPAFSAFITAGGRVQLYEMIQYYGAQNVIYSDTDSVKVVKSIYDSKPKHPQETDLLGGWKNEGTYTGLVVSAPKVYAGIHDGEIEIKAKGLSMRGLLKLNGNAHKRKLNETEKEREKRLIEELYKLIKRNEVVKAEYSAKPKKMKGFVNDTSSFALTSSRSITRPENVTGYTFNGIRYSVKVINEPKISVVNELLDEKHMKLL